MNNELTPSQICGGMVDVLLSSRVDSSLAITDLTDVEYNALEKLVLSAYAEQPKPAKAGSLLTQKSVDSVLDEVEFFGAQNPDSNVGVLRKKLFNA